MSATVVSFTIIGRTADGKSFRPSDWADRLCGIMSVFGADRKMKFSPYVRPGTMNGDKCVMVDERLHKLEPLAYKFLANFATDNDLKVEYAEESASVSVTG
ncbi:DUF3579 domain-containing protein [Uliginosibacterium sp. H3]|uniref:DUF3579 domain-containing protein n=1 Tax=Uliginosibacterium silvisoli TaxID=3114758 RepID=A0ABU6K6N7_9RHOO|nr:DUF3579 domain-containing protein [Uliginosibacterium sp. H3]